MDLTPLHRFTKRIEDIRDRKLELAVAEMVRAAALTIQDYVRETYPDAVVTLLSVDQKNSTFSAIIDIHAKDLWFREFGTGFAGASTPNWDYQPTVELSFFSRGEIQHTNGWEYLYHPISKKLGGWWYTDPVTGKSAFSEGQVAEHGVTKAIIRVKYGGIPLLAAFVRTHMG